MTLMLLPTLLTPSGNTFSKSIRHPGQECCSHLFLCTACLPLCCSSHPAGGQDSWSPDICLNVSYVWAQVCSGLPRHSGGSPGDRLASVSLIPFLPNLFTSPLVHLYEFITYKSPFISSSSSSLCLSTLQAVMRGALCEAELIFLLDPK